MSKRRTRKQKAGAKHTFKQFISDQNFPKPKPVSVTSKHVVKGQLTFESKPQEQKNTISEIAESKPEIIKLGTIKRDLIKTILTACLILASEAVLYFVWQ